MDKRQKLLEPQDPPKCEHGRTFNPHSRCPECRERDDKIKTLVNPLINEWWESKGENLNLYHYAMQIYRMGMRNEHLSDSEKTGEIDRRKRYKFTPPENVLRFLTKELRERNGEISGHWDVDLFINGWLTEIEEKLSPCLICKEPRGYDEHGAAICPCPHCGDKIPF